MASGGFGSGAVPRNDETNSQEETPAYILDRPSLNVQKTPISYLQEMCTRKTLKPEYELLSTEGQVSFSKVFFHWISTIAKIF